MSLIHFYLILHKNPLLLFAFLFLPTIQIVGQETPENIQSQITDTIIGRQFLEEGKTLIEQGEYEEAKSKLLQAKEIFTRATGIETLEIADCYHQIGRIFQTNGDNDQALSYYQSALSIRSAKLSERHLGVAHLYYNIGNVYLNLEDFELALQFHNKSLKIREELLSSHVDWQMSYSLGQTGFCFIQLGEFLKAESYIKKAIEIQVQIDENSFYNGLLHGRLGYIYFCLYDFIKAIEFHEKAIFLIKKNPNPNSATSEAWNKTIIGNCYAEIGEYRKGEAYLNEALNFWIEYYGNEHAQVAQLYNDIGYLFFLETKFEKAILFHEKALNIRLGIPNISKADLGQSYINLGDCSYMQDKFQQAITLYTKAYENRMLSIGSNHPFTLMCLINIARCYKKMQEYDRANYFLTKAVQALNAEFFNPETSVGSAPNVVIHALSEKIDLSYNWYRKSDIESHLINAVKTADLADKYIDFFSTRFVDNSYFFVSRQSFFENSIRATILLNELDKKANKDKFKEFYYSEKCKSLTLYSLIQDSKALRYAGIPDSLLQQENNIRVEISNYEKKRQEKLDSGQHETDTVILAYSNRLFNLRQEYESLKHHFETFYPAYYHAKYDLSTISLEETQQQLLRPGEALLEYFVGDSSVYVFVVRPDTFAVHEIAKNFPLDSLVAQLREGIYGYYEAENRPDTLYPHAARQYAQAAQQMYDHLVSPVQDLLPKRLYIVPDGVLGYIPFEALLMEKPQRPERFHTHRYFGKEHVISYAYSATLLREMREKQHRQEPGQSLLAMAPFYQGDVLNLSESIDTNEILLALRSDTLSALPASGEEALRIAKAYDGKPLLGTSASKAAFEQEAEDYRFLHLSTHGVADDRIGDYAWLAFARPGDSTKFEKLYVRDIYNLSLNADMVVLSACRAGIGKLQRGEGIISLSRAFAYAGAKSVLTTLWSVDDDSTKDFMITFYRYLLEMPKAEALWQTRLDFLAKRKGEAAHPYYWAAFIGIGDL